MTQIAGVDFVTLLVSDLAASYEFYKVKLGLVESSEKRPNAHAFSMEPVGLAIRQAPEGPRIDNPGQGIIVWLKTSDATALHEDFQRRGIPIVDELRKSPFGMTFSFRDPDGYVLSVHDGG
jgi:predicted enzyme related to lactoylglutathione lyase